MPWQEGAKDNVRNALNKAVKDYADNIHEKGNAMEVARWMNRNKNAATYKYLGIFLAELGRTGSIVQAQQAALTRLGD